MSLRGHRRSTIVLWRRGHKISSSAPTETAAATSSSLDQVYPDHVYFYGRELTHTALMKRSPERRANSSGSARLKLELQDGMTILSEDGNVIPSNRNPSSMTQAPRAPLSPPATQSAVPTAPVTEASPPGEEVDPQWQETNPSPNDIVALRNAYVAHGADKDWITAWLAQKRDFSGEAVVVGATEDQAAPGADGAVRTVGFTSAAGTVACINPDGATSLKVGEKVNLHGVITIFIEDVMYLGQCSVQPG